MSDVGVVLVHGLWHGAWSWDGVRARLTVPSVAVELPLTDLAADVDVTLRALDAIARPAVLVGHSYGGAVVTAAGAHPLVRELVYLAAFQLDDGESVGRVLPHLGLPPTRLGDALRFSDSSDEVYLDTALAADLFYGDAPPDLAAAATARLRPVHRPVFRGTPDRIGWRAVPSTYVVCTADRVVNPDLERAMARRATRQVEIECGHSLPITRPGAAADLILAAVARAATN